MDSYKDLQAWKVGLSLVKEMYGLTKKLPKEELFGLVSQMRRCSVSVLANIAEGFGRFTFADKANKYTIARGECTEAEALILIILELSMVKAEETKSILSLIDREGKLLSGLIASCRQHQ